MSNLLQKVPSAWKGLLIGCALGVGFAETRRTLSEADATLFFPPSLVFLSEAAAADGKSEGETPAKNFSLWAQETLMSKEAVDALCKRIERSEAEDKAALIRSACLLPEDGRIAVETLPSSCVRLRVRAETTAQAVTLCEGLLAYLTFKTKIPLEDPNVEKLSSVERTLRVQEKALSRTLWGIMSFEAKNTQLPGELQSLTLDLQEFQTSVAQYKMAMREHFYREAKAAAAGPGFTIIEPPTAVPQGRPWPLSALVGGGIGWLLGSLSSRKARKVRPENVPWRVQEREAYQRTAGSVSVE